MEQNRRKFIIHGLQGVGLAAMGGLVWSAYLNEAKATPLLLRPPGAGSEEELLSTCIKCGLCVNACPFDTLRLAKPGDGRPVGTPYFVPREVPCYMCPDIPCVPVCPTETLSVDRVSTEVDGKKILDINRADMGLAVVDQENCIAFWGIQCDACYRACPLMDEAISLEYKRNERTGKHTYLLPIVHSEHCTGCGLCERACVTEKASIFVLPREIAQGKVGAGYIKGWDAEDEKRLKDATSDTTTTKRSNQAPVDYLNDGGF